MKLPKGHVCGKCRKRHRWPRYVYAHWRDIIVHTCTCGEKATLVAGSVDTPNTLFWKIKDGESA
jgi:hypothetical protein